jgi:cation/acetate symporter
VLSPTIWVDLLHHAEPIFRLRNPAIISMPCGFVAGIVASLLVSEPAAEEMFHEEKLRTYLGIGAE